MIININLSNNKTLCDNMKDIFMTSDNQNCLNSA